VRREENIGERAQRVFRLQRFFLVGVDDGSRQMSSLECVEQRALVDDSSTRHVDDDRSLWKPGKLALADHPGRFLGQRRVDSQNR
jgi:hypothetical protein